MKIGVGADWIVCAGEVINESREYSHILSWFSFSRHDTMVVAKHKKELKIINWKNIGDGMSVFYFLPRKEFVLETINQSWFSFAFGMFQWFDEETWKTNSFLYKVSEKELESIQNFLNINQQDLKLNKTEKWIFVEWKVLSWDAVWEKDLWDVDFVVSFLFALTLLYGIFEVKNKELISAKIHIPLFGVYENKKEFFDSMVDILKSKWIFLQKSIVVSNNWIVYQIACQDYEILNAFKNIWAWYVDVERVLKYEQIQEIKQQLNAFIVDYTGLENSREFSQQLQNDWIIKVLNK